MPSEMQSSTPAGKPDLLGRDLMAGMVSQIVLQRPGSSRSEIMDGLAELMRQQGRPFAASVTTVYRWLEQAISLGYLTRDGNTRAARYSATELMRIHWFRQQLTVPASQRERRSYNEEFLLSYVPNKSAYLSPRNRERLAARCPIGSAALSRLGPQDINMFQHDVSFWSSRLEGNAYDQAGAVQLLEQQIPKPGASDTDRLMILNHQDAARHLLDNATEVRPSDLLNLHAILSQDLMKDHRHCGALRKSHMDMRDSAFTPPDTQARISTLFETLLHTARQIDDPWEQALFLNVQLAYLQPFEDCNNSTARVACNIPLFKQGVTPMSWVDVNPKDYTDGLLAVCEFNDATLLGEVFTEGYLRSSERFSVLQRQAKPDRIALDYRHEIRKAVRDLVLEGREVIPPSVASEHAASFDVYVKQQIRAMLESPANAARFSITAQELRAFAQTFSARQAHHVERGVEHGVERDIAPPSAGSVASAASSTALGASGGSSESGGLGALARLKHPPMPPISLGMNPAAQEPTQIHISPAGPASAAMLQPFGLHDDLFEDLGSDEQAQTDDDFSLAGMRQVARG